MTRANLSTRFPSPAIAASLALHALLLILLFSLPKTPATIPLPEEAISVELLPPPPPAPVMRELTAPPKSLAPSKPPAQATAAPAPMIRATSLYAARMLAGPRSRQAREALAQLSGPDRMEQLCDAEAMEQIARWKQEFQPDRLIAYAMDDTRIDGAIVIADSAAFRSKGRWYHVKFRCSLTVDLKTVASFEFQVGEPIPREQWAAHYLSVDDTGE